METETRKPETTAEDAPDVLEFERGELRIEVRGPRWLIKDADVDVSFWDRGDGKLAERILGALGAEEGWEVGAAALKLTPNARGVSVYIYGPAEFRRRHDPARRDRAGVVRRLSRLAGPLGRVRAPLFRNEGPDEDVAAFVGIDEDGCWTVETDDPWAPLRYETPDALAADGWVIAPARRAPRADRPPGRVRFGT